LNHGRVQSASYNVVSTITTSFLEKNLSTKNKNNHWKEHSMGDYQQRATNENGIGDRIIINEIT